MRSLKANGIKDYDGTSDEIRSDWKGRMDYVGINYYTRLTVSWFGEGLVERLPKLTFLPDTSNLFDQYPQRYL